MTMPPPYSSSPSYQYSTSYHGTTHDHEPSSSNSNSSRTHSRNKSYEKPRIGREDYTDDDEDNFRPKPTGNRPSAGGDESSDGQFLYNEGKSFDDTRGSGGGESSAVGEAKYNSQSQAEMKAAEFEEFKSLLNFTNDKILVCLNLKGYMVVRDYQIHCDILQRFEERYGEGDCLHLAKLYHRERDGKAFVDYMMKIADYNERPQRFVRNSQGTYRFASYWIGWDANKNERFQKPGPCISDHVVLHGTLATQWEQSFIYGENLYPKFNENMIIENNDEDDGPPDHRVCWRSKANIRNTYMEGWFNPENDDPRDHDGRMIYSLQTLSRLRKAIDDPT